MQDKFTPFKNIGLCFSGGGYRATFFSLGAASYLNQALFGKNTLLKNVTAISTVSGGTLFGVAFAKAVASPDFDFESFYAEMHHTFTPPNDSLLKDAVAKISNDSVWNFSTHKRQSLINAFALHYAQMPLFKGLFNELDFNNKNSYRLKNVCFNATDFTFGLPFRFQNSGTFGNAALKGKEINALKDHTVLGDIVASSSCFPLGFEPLVFPDDFYGNHISAKNKISQAYNTLKEQAVFKAGVGIMDGGVADNQGIESMLNIHNRKNSKLDLIIINDVSSFQMEAWKPSDIKIENEKSIHTTVSTLLKWLDYTLPFLGIFL